MSYNNKSLLIKKKLVTSKLGVTNTGMTSLQGITGPTGSKGVTGPTGPTGQLG